ncbi:hypothetical protein X760_30660 [Mesorhizobium sp. LSHC422A00]|nr:hypothetical protein X760_30660 [Mesorhizobium sp. LSHC422A00]
MSTGDHSVQNLTIYHQLARDDLPPAADVDIRKELADLRDLLGRIADKDRPLVEVALTEAEALADRPNPDKDKVASTLERAIEYAGSAEKLATHGEKLWPTLKAIGGWLGEYGPKVLRLAGVAIV